ncbi:protein phosphatase CheZ [Maritalea mediterranea]|uniref:Protein phosphatase CheZ n=1 Tax=Maritalea mediterranea TaxID=2909667 RepID=A0ABS9E4H3_9HYPH|nr:protein phosphatase CheZ [Maritalea mediterranea]MCF4097767.1 protein phosphatase CheZ [Maritalea mediterranea]
MGHAAEKSGSDLDLTDLAERDDERIPLKDVIALAEKVTTALKPLVRSLDRSMHQELKEILQAIEGLRSELSRVDANDIFAKRIPEMGRELSAIVKATEVATDTIMNVAEQVLAADKSDPQKYAAEVEQHMMAIFEACSFQDLTGQRVTKIIHTMEVIEDRIEVLCKMIENNNIAPLSSGELTDREKRNRDKLVSGPAHDGEGVSQSDIDAMF